MKNAKKITVQKAERSQWGNAGAGWVLSRSAEVSVAERCLAPGVREVKHYHEKAWQFFYVLAGEGVIHVDGEELTLSRGEAVEVPAGARHQMVNAGEGELCFLVTSVPNTEGDRIELP